MSIQLIIAPEPDNPDRPCKPFETIGELIESKSFKIWIDAIYEEAPEGEPKGNCHNIVMSIMGDLIAAGRSKGWEWVKGRRKGSMPDGGDFVHSWLESDGWAIDASNTPNIPVDNNDGKPILFIDATRYREMLNCKVTSRRNDKVTWQLIEKWDRQINKKKSNIILIANIGAPLHNPTYQNNETTSCVATMPGVKGSKHQIE